MESRPNNLVIAESPSFVFDNNVFSIVTSSESEISRLIQHMRIADKRIYIPADVLFQRMQGSNPKAITASLFNFRKLMHEFHRGKVRILGSYPFVLQKELERKGKLKKAPEILNYDHFLIDENTKDPERLLKLLESYVKIEKRRKETFYSIDYDTKERLSEAPDNLKQDIIKAIEDIYDFTKDPYAYMVMKPFFRDSRYILSRRKFKKISSSSLSDYKCFKAAINLLYLKRLLTHAEQLPPKLHLVLGKALRAHLDDSVDITIAAPAAYAQFLVTNDVGLSQMCNYLSSKDIINFRAIDLNTFYSFG